MDAQKTENSEKPSKAPEKAPHWIEPVIPQLNKLAHYGSTLGGLVFFGMIIALLLEFMMKPAPRNPADWANTLDQRTSRVLREMYADIGNDERRLAAADYFAADGGIAKSTEAFSITVRNISRIKGIPQYKVDQAERAFSAHQHEMAVIGSDAFAEYFTTDELRDMLKLSMNADTVNNARRNYIDKKCFAVGSQMMQEVKQKYDEWSETKFTGYIRNY